MGIEVYTLNAFGVSEKGGNPAGVVILNDEMSDKKMQLIAKKVGLSETAFFKRLDGEADFSLRFFTPNKEVDLCGHATIATYSLIKELNIISNGRYIQKTKAGILEIVIEDNNVFMEQTLPKFSKKIDKDEIAKSLNIDVSDIHSELPVQIVSTGLRDIFVPIKSLDVLKNIDPNFKKIEEVSEKYDAVGYHLFTLETIDDSTANCRNFAPFYGIDEEAATGTSNGALACYLDKYNMINKDEKEMIFEQGYYMNRPSKIVVKLEKEFDTLTKVMVGGYASGIEKKTLEI